MAIDYLYHFLSIFMKTIIVLGRKPRVRTVVKQHTKELMSITHPVMTNPNYYIIPTISILNNRYSAYQNHTNFDSYVITVMLPGNINGKYKPPHNNQPNTHFICRRVLLANANLSKSVMHPSRPKTSQSWFDDIQSLRKDVIRKGRKFTLWLYNMTGNLLHCCINH